MSGMVCDSTCFGVFDGRADLLSRGLRGSILRKPLKVKQIYFPGPWQGYPLETATRSIGEQYFAHSLLRIPAAAFPVWEKICTQVTDATRLHPSIVLE